MTDETKIEPALSADEWADLRDPASRADLMRQLGFGTDAGAIAQTIAILNDALPDTDRRKIARAMVEHLKRVHWEWRQATRGQSDHESREGWAARTWQLIQILESYLPPEGT